MTNFETKKVRISSNSLTFSSAHFLFSKNKCERLHGHNFKVTFEVEGTQNHHGMIFDILTLKSLGEQVCKELDHRILVPSKAKELKATINGDQIEITIAHKKRYSLPKDDVLFLPLEAITLEELIEYIFMKYIQTLKLPRNVKKFYIRMEEIPGHEVIAMKDLNVGSS